MNENQNKILNLIAELPAKERKEILTYLLDKYTYNNTMVNQIVDLTNTYLNRLINNNRLSPLYEYDVNSGRTTKIFDKDDIHKLANDFRNYRQSIKLLREKK